MLTLPSAYPPYFLCVCVCVCVCVRKGLVKSSEVPSTSTIGIIRGKYHMTIKVPGDVYIHTYLYTYTHTHTHTHIYIYIYGIWDFPGDASGKEPTCQCRRQKRHGLDPWVGKSPWRRAWQPIPLFLPGESHRVAKSRTRLKQLGTHTNGTYLYLYGIYTYIYIYPIKIYVHINLSFQD